MRRTFLARIQSEKNAASDSFKKKIVTADMLTPNQGQVSIQQQQHVGSTCSTRGAHTFARHSNVDAFLQTTELATVATVRRYLARPIGGTLMTHTLCNTSPEETLQEARQQNHTTTKSTALETICIRINSCIRRALASFFFVFFL
jgi:hypothetical protein